jgi:hypothetical protein
VYLSGFLQAGEFFRGDRWRRFASQSFEAIPQVIRGHVVVHLIVNGMIVIGHI